MPNPRLPKPPAGWRWVDDYGFTCDAEPPETRGARLDAIREKAKANAH